MDKLLPCPFCGTEPRVAKTNDGRTYIGCDNLRTCPAFPSTYPSVNEEAAVKAWNTRAVIQ